MNRFPMNLQLFAEPAAGQQGNQGVSGGTGTAGASGTGNGQPAGAAPQFDYEKLASLIAGKTSVTEDTVLKSYFKQQGLSQEEMTQAIAAFKQQKAATQPDANALQGQVAEAQKQATEAQAAARQAQLESAATMMAVTLGIDTKTIPYVLKMADLSQVMGQDGKINEETLKAALNKVLEDIPALKPQAAAQAGFIQVGASGSGNQQQANDDALKAAFGLK